MKQFRSKQLYITYFYEWDNPKFRFRMFRHKPKWTFKGWNNVIEITLFRNDLIFEF
jgi:hypothetical protein